MIYGFADQGSKIKATPKVQAVCPSCDGELIAKCGSVNIWHFAHKVQECDSWYEPESEWHLRWKDYAKPEHCEVIVGKHRADVLGSRGVVVELQNSSISAEKILERERHYGKMVWIVNANDFAKRLNYFHQINLNDRVESRAFFWDHPRKSWFVATKPVFLDLGECEIRIPVDERWTYEYAVNNKYSLTNRRSTIISNGLDALICIKKFPKESYDRFHFYLVKKSKVIEKYFA